MNILCTTKFKPDGMLQKWIKTNVFEGIYEINETVEKLEESNFEKIKSDFKVTTYTPIIGNGSIQAMYSKGIKNMTINLKGAVDREKEVAQIAQVYLFHS